MSDLWSKYFKDKEVEINVKIRNTTEIPEKPKQSILERERLIWKSARKNFEAGNYFYAAWAASELPQTKEVRELYKAAKEKLPVHEKGMFDWLK